LETVMLNDHALPKNPSQKQREHRWTCDVKNFRFMYKSYKLTKTRLANDLEWKRGVVDLAGHCRRDNRNLRILIRCMCSAPGKPLTELHRDRLDAADHRSKRVSVNQNSHIDWREQLSSNSIPGS
jgi:hypothetical protein